MKIQIKVNSRKTKAFNNPEDAIDYIYDFLPMPHPVSNINKPDTLKRVSTIDSLIGWKIIPINREVKDEQ